MRRDYADIRHYKIHSGFVIYFWDVMLPNQSDYLALPRLGCDESTYGALRLHDGVVLCTCDLGGEERRNNTHTGNACLFTTINIKRWRQVSWNKQSDSSQSSGYARCQDEMMRKRTQYVLLGSVEDDTGRYISHVPNEISRRDTGQTSHR